MKKKVCYAVFFALLNFIDLFRQILNGDGWSVAVCATGLVVFGMTILANKDFKPFTVFNIVVTVILLGVLGYTFTIEEPRLFGAYIWAARLVIINVWCLVIAWKDILLQALQQKKLPMKLSVPLCCWTVLMVLMWCSVNEAVWPIWYWGTFLGLFCTMQDEDDKKAFFEGMINGTIIYFFICQTYAYGFRPYDIMHYQGAYANCNLTALHYSIVYVMILMKLYSLLKEKAKWPIITFYVVGAMGMIDFIVLTLCRTAWLTVSVITIMYAVLILKFKICAKWRYILASGVGFIVGIMIMFPVVFATVRWLPTILHHPIWYEVEGYSVDRVHSFDDKNSEKYIEMDEFLEVFSTRITTIKNLIDKQLGLVMQAEAMTLERIPIEGSRDLDTSTRNRLTIVKAYLRDATLWGNSNERGHYIITDTEYQSWHAQNVFLQIWYFYGKIAGVAFVVLMIILLIRDFRMYLHGDDVGSVMPLFILALFLTYGMLELVWEPGQMILALMFLAHGRNYARR